MNNKVEIFPHKNCILIKRGFLPQNIIKHCINICKKQKTFSVIKVNTNIMCFCCVMPSSELFFVYTAFAIIFKEILRHKRINEMEKVQWMMRVVDVCFYVGFVMNATVSKSIIRYKMR